jgi:hypothetical protein
MANAKNRLHGRSMFHDPVHSMREDNVDRAFENKWPAVLGTLLEK